MGLHPLSAATRRNFRLSVLNGAVMIGTNNSVASPDLVMTTFAAHLTTSPLLLGAIVPLGPATWSLPQWWMVGCLQHMQRVLPIYRLSALIRVVCWSVLIVITLFMRDAGVLLAALFGFLVIAGIAGGIAGLPFIEVISKAVPPRQRGQVFGLRSAFGGLLAILGAQVVIALAGPGTPLDFPANYGVLFLIAGVVQAGGMIAFLKIDEPSADAQVHHARPSLGVLRRIWRTDGNYRHYVRGRTLYMFSNMASGLVIVYANQQLGVRLGMAGLYLLVGSLLSPAASAVGGRLSVRLGNRLPVTLAVMVQAVGWGLLLLAGPLGITGRAAEIFLFSIYGLLAIHKGLIFSNMMALGLNVTPQDEHALYMGAVNSWIGVVTLITMLNGVVVGLIGFEALFALALGCACVAAWQFGTLVEAWRGDT